MNLFESVRQNKVIHLRQCVANGEDINGQAYRQRTALHMAARQGHCEVVRALLELGADPNITDHVGVTPIYIAASKGQSQILRVFYEFGVDIFCKQSCPRGGSFTPLEIAFFTDQIEMARILIELGAEAGIDEHSLHSSLVESLAISGNCKWLDVAFNSGLSPYWLNPDGSNRSLLHHAAFEGHCDAIYLLVAQGVPLEIQEYAAGDTALSLAAMNNHSAAVRVLCELGANIHHINWMGQMPTHLAMSYWYPLCMDRCVETERVLKACGADLHAYTSQDATTLAHLAVLTTSSECYGIDVDGDDDDISGNSSDVINAHGEKVCTNSSIAVILAFLQEAGVDICREDWRGYTPLMLAAAMGHRPAMSALVCLGADPTQSNSHGYNAVWSAVRERNTAFLDVFAHMLPKSVLMVSDVLILAAQVDCPELFSYCHHRFSCSFDNIIDLNTGGEESAEDRERENNGRVGVGISSTNSNTSSLSKSLLTIAAANASAGVWQLFTEGPQAMVSSLTNSVDNNTGNNNSNSSNSNTNTNTLPEITPPHDDVVAAVVESNVGSNSCDNDDVSDMTDTRSTTTQKQQQQQHQRRIYTAAPWELKQCEFWSTANTLLYNGLTATNTIDMFGYCPEDAGSPYYLCLLRAADQCLMFIKTAGRAFSERHLPTLPPPLSPLLPQSNINFTTTCARALTETTVLHWLCRDTLGAVQLRYLTWEGGRRLFALCGVSYQQYVNTLWNNSRRMDTGYIFATITTTTTTTTTWNNTDHQHDQVVKIITQLLELIFHPDRVSDVLNLRLTCKSCAHEQTFPMGVKFKNCCIPLNLIESYLGGEICFAVPTGVVASALEVYNRIHYQATLV